MSVLGIIWYHAFRLDNLTSSTVKLKGDMLVYHFHLTADSWERRVGFTGKKNSVRGAKLSMTYLTMLTVFH